MLSITGEDTAIGELNPIRYRGYYQDVETGLYYLQSRYYDPATMRFINADDPNIIQMGSTEKQELNLYAYCVNDPVNSVDPTGYGAILLFNVNGYTILGVRYGHIALLVYSRTAWYYFSLNGDRYVHYYRVGGKYSITKSTTLYTINQIPKKLKTIGSYIHSYTNKIYFSGDFLQSYYSVAAAYRSINNGSSKYNLLTNNCSQVVFKALARVSTKYRNTFLYASKISLPVSAYWYAANNCR